MERILIIDDSLTQARYLESILKDTYMVQVCVNPRAAIESIRQFRPCVILLDIIMPEINGLALLKQIKQDSEINKAPVILISGLSDVGHEKQGLDLGAVDYIVKPYSKDIVKARVRTHVRIYTLQQSMEVLMQMDALTGVFNRRYVEERGKDSLLQSIDRNALYTLGMIDVDCFKKYNDCYGHLGGDVVLRVVAQTAQNCLPSGNGFIARYGGEEFLFCMTNTPLQESRAVAENICRSIAAAEIAHAGSWVAPVLTASIGGLTAPAKRGQTLDDWIRQADKQLYLAKDGGRNRVIWREGMEDT